MTDLYWTDGPAVVKLFHPTSIPQAHATKSVRILEDFRLQCQRIWFAFNGMTNGRSLARERWSNLSVGRHNTVSVGTQFPDAIQSIGKSTFARITFGELMDAMVDGGEFEQLNTKAFLVFIDALWEDSARKRIADTLHVKKRDIKCDLMADVRRLRNLMLHQSEDAKSSYATKAAFLPRIWTIDPDNVVVTGAMLQALIEQLNAIQVHVGDAR